MMKKIVVLFSLLFSLYSFGWGNVGHRASGLIADAHLTPKSKMAISQLIGQQSLADVANWADTIKSGNTYEATRRYHYENIADGFRYLKNLQAMPKEQRALGGVVQAVLLCQDILRSPTATKWDKADALKFITHFIGDIHQPLHTGRPQDNGATKISVTWFGNAMSLHGVWDYGMIETGHQDFLKPGMSLEQASLAYAQYLVQGAQRARVVYQPTSVETWLNESIQLRSQTYDQLYNKDQARYQALNLPYLDARVLYSGLRIADTLNQIFANTPPPNADISLKQQIESIVGAISKIINIKP
ncbi:MAG: S1/P1 nuclease [Bdellovibrionaceae bacterium]|nr:S1/P1 nuclease [Pseudobdellovibrionaceae bacterium]